MSTLSDELLLAQLSWRYAVKQFDPGRPVSAELWRKLEEALVLTPSSYGLQPWKFIIVTDSALKTRLRAASWNQSQVSEGSHLVVFAIQKQVDQAYIERFLDRTAEVRQIPAGGHEELRRPHRG